MRTRPLLHGLVAIVAASFLAACGKDPIPTQPDLPNLAEKEIVGIEVSGADTVLAGQRVQLFATLSLSDGTSKKATSMQNLKWRSSNPALSVSNSGMLSASPSGYGETAEITAEITSGRAVQATRQVTIRTKSALSGDLDVTEEGTPGQAYVFALKVTESGGVPGNITSIWITLDSGWSGECNWTPANLNQTRVPANGTLVLEPLKCGWSDSWDAEVYISVKDENGYETGVYLYKSVRRQGR